MPELVQQLPDGPIDFIGDVHGELEALQQLLSHLGYQTDGTHPEGRRLVFLGDLVDRGPDSPAVALLVRQLVINGNASCILGNHEMNVLLGKKRTYNRWLGHQEGMPGPLEQAPQRRHRHGAHQDFGLLPHPTCCLGARCLKSGACVLGRSCRRGSSSIWS